MTRAPLFLVLFSVLLTGCSERFLLRTGIKMGNPYMQGPTAQGTSFEKVSAHVYTAKWNWYRTIVVDTSEGLVIFDPAGPAMVQVIKDGIAKHLKGKSVRALVYSHYHLDHVTGGASLSPQEVIGHAKCAQYWKDVGAKDVLPITRPIEGDRTLTFGGVEIRALYLGKSHSDTLYAFHFPGERILFTADMGLVKTMMPLGGPDGYWPGNLAALERLSALDFDTFVPAHFGWGRKQDFLDFAEMLKTSRRLAKEALARVGGMGEDKPFEDYFDHIYPELAARYGTWHGFSAMFVSNMARDLMGETLGY